MITYEQLAKAVSGTEYRTLQSIGDDLGVTRERIRQLLNKHNLVNVSARQKPDMRKDCLVCNLPVDKERKPLKFVYGKGWSKEGFKYLKYHTTCWEEKIWTTEVCSCCEKSFKIRHSDKKRRLSRMSLNNGWLFCSRRCVNRHRAKHPSEGNFNGFKKGHSVRNKSQNNGGKNNDK